MVIFVHERRLQREADQRNAEDQQAVDRILGRGRRAPHVEDRDPHVEDEEQREERLHDRVMGGIVELAPPRQAEHEREHEAHGVERAPGLGPGEREDRGVQDGKVAEQQQGSPSLPTSTGARNPPAIANAASGCESARTASPIVSAATPTSSTIAGASGSTP